MPQTLLANIIDTDVMAEMISAKVENGIRLTPLAVVDNSLVGRPGSEVIVPVWEYIGPAEDVAEGQPIPITAMSATEKKMTIKKAGKGVEITDEAALSGVGDPIGEGTNQIALSITDKIEIDMITAIATATQTSTATGGLNVTNLEAALGVFNDEDDAQAVLIANPTDAAVLRTDANKNWINGTELGAARFISGVFGEILGVQVVRSRRVTAGTAYLVKAGALRLVKKRDVAVESDRDIIKKTTVITGDAHYGTYLYDPTKAVKITVA